MGKAAKKRKGRKRRADHGAGCGFCPAEIDLFGKTRADRRAELEEAGWSSVLVIPHGKEYGQRYNACPKCSDRLGPGPIDHVRRDARY